MLWELLLAVTFKLALTGKRHERKDACESCRQISGSLYLRVLSGQSDVRGEMVHGSWEAWTTVLPHKKQELSVSLPVSITGSSITSHKCHHLVMPTKRPGFCSAALCKELSGLHWQERSSKARWNFVLLDKSVSEHMMSSASPPKCRFPVELASCPAGAKMCLLQENRTRVSSSLWLALSVPCSGYHLLLSPLPISTIFLSQFVAPSDSSSCCQHPPETCSALPVGFHKHKSFSVSRNQPISYSWTPDKGWVWVWFPSRHQKVVGCLGAVRTCKHFWWSRQKLQIRFRSKSNSKHFWNEARVWIWAWSSAWFLLWIGARAKLIPSCFEFSKWNTWSTSSKGEELETEQGRGALQQSVRWKLFWGLLSWPGPPTSVSFRWWWLRDGLVLL